MDNILDGVNLVINFTISEQLKAQTNGKFLECNSCGKVFNTGVNYMTPDQVGENSLVILLILKIVQ